MVGKLGVGSPVYTPDAITLVVQVTRGRRRQFAIDDEIDLEAAPIMGIQDPHVHFHPVLFRKKGAVISDAKSLIRDRTRPPAGRYALGFLRNPGSTHHEE